MQIKVGDLVRHKYHTKYGIGLVVKAHNLPHWIQVNWVKPNVGPRSQRVENLARVK
jgi:hypothetical protein